MKVNKGKLKLTFIFSLMLIIIILSAFKSIPEVQADSNYSNYLTNESISVKNDRALILLENSGSSNNYRNYYETSFLFPSKLRDEMYSIDLTTNPSKYYIQQAYLSDLDNEYAFSAVENLGQYETNDFIENYIEITELTGNYNNTDSTSIFVPIGETLGEWNNDYTSIDDYPYINDGDAVVVHSAYFSDIYDFNTDFEKNISKIEIFVRIRKHTGYAAPCRIGLILDGNQTFQNIPITTSFVTNKFTYYVTQNNFSVLQVHLRADYVTTTTYCTAIWVKLYDSVNRSILQSNDNDCYNYISEKSGGTAYINADSDIANVWDYQSGEPHYAQIVGYPSVDDAKYIGISSVDDNQVEKFGMENYDIEASTIESLTVYFYCKISSAGYNDMEMNIKAGSELGYKPFSITSTTLVWMSLTWSGESLSQSDINDMEVWIDPLGVGGSAQSRIHGLYVSFSTEVSILNLTSSLLLNREGDNFDNLESLEFEYTFRTNDSCNLDLYLKNTDSNEFDLINTELLTLNFQEFIYTYSLNYSYYNTLGLTEFMLYMSGSNPLLISIDKICLKAIFSNFSLNENGFHNIEIKFNRKTSGATNRGNISFNLQLYQTYFSYDYIENNVIENDYEKLNQIINFSNEIDDIIEIEIQAHIRYGLNTLDIEICNVYYLVLINYDWSFELFEQLRFGNNDGNYFRAEFAYSSMNFNRLNNTGIFGNYSSNSLSGLRVLRGETGINYNRYFTIPYFDEKITLSYSLAISESGAGSEPRLPSGHYWTYETFRMADAGNIGITVENWSIDFRQIQAEKYEAKYFYKPKVLKRSDLGNWQFKITGDYKVSFNFIRNAVCDILNLILLFFQYLFFLVVASFSYIFMFLGINILVLLWNTIVYYVFTGLIWVLWYLYVGLFWLLSAIWEGLVWVYENLLIPFYIWFTEIAVPWLIEFVIIPAIAFTITLIIWCLTLGRVDFWELYAVIHEQLIITSDIFIEIVIEIFDHIVEVILFIGLYLLLILLCLLKHIVIKARGYTNRATALRDSYEAYLYPIEKFYQICIRLKNLIAQWF